MINWLIRSVKKTWNTAIACDKVIEEIKGYYLPQTTNPKILPNPNAFLGKGISLDELQEKTKIKRGVLIDTIKLLQEEKIVVEKEKGYLLTALGEKMNSYRWQEAKRILIWFAPILIIFGSAWSLIKHLVRHLYSMLH